MVKRTLFFGNPAWLSTAMEQLVIEINNQTRQVPLEDIGVMVLENPQIVITQALLAKAVAYNIAVVSCGESHLPNGMFLPLEGHPLQNARLRAQLIMNAEMAPELWRQTIQYKIQNQGKLLALYGQSAEPYLRWAKQVAPGDPENYEGRAAARYWPELLPAVLSLDPQGPPFRRDRDGDPPNNLLNYGYAILRAAAARALTGSGLLPALGIHHHNRGNAYCLADDLMEPYRPFVDWIVRRIADERGLELFILDKELKAKLLSILTHDVMLDGQQMPLMLALERSTASLAQCYEGKRKTILYPTLR